MDTQKEIHDTASANTNTNTSQQVTQIRIPAEPTPIRFTLYESTSKVSKYKCPKQMIKSLISEHKTSIESNFWGTCVMKPEKSPIIIVYKYIYERDGDEIKIYIMRIYYSLYRGFQMQVEEYIGTFSGLMKNSNNYLLSSTVNIKSFDNLMYSLNINLVSDILNHGSVIITQTTPEGDKLTDRLYMPGNKNIDGELRHEGIKKGINKEFRETASELDQIRQNLVAEYSAKESSNRCAIS